MAQSVFFLWDKGLSFYELYHAIFTELERSVLGQRVMAVPALRRMDLDTLLACAGSDAEPDQHAQPDQEEPPVSWFEAELLHERAQILDAARADRMKPCANERADEAHEGLLAFARHRRAYVTGQVERGCSPPSSEPGRTLPDFGHPRRPERSYTSTGFMARARLNSAPRAGHEAMSGPHHVVSLLPRPVGGARGASGRCPRRGGGCHDLPKRAGVVSPILPGPHHPAVRGRRRWSARRCRAG